MTNEIDEFLADMVPVNQQEDEQHETSEPDDYYYDLMVCWMKYQERLNQFENYK